LSRYHAPRVQSLIPKTWVSESSAGVAMIQTLEPLDADQSHAPGATAARVIGILLILQGGWRLYSTIKFALLAFERGLNNNAAVFAVITPSVMGLLTVSVGILLVRRDHSAKVFGLVVCSIALVYQVFTSASLFMSLYVLVPGRTPNALVWALPAVYIVLFVASIIVIARWRPYQLPDYYAPPPR